MLFDYFINYLYMRVLKLTLGNFFFLHISLCFSASSVNEAFELTCSWVQTCLALAISSLTPCRPDEYVPRPDASFLLSLPNTHTIFFSVLSCCVVCVFSWTNPEILAFSAHLFSSPGISFDFPYSLKLRFFLEYWNL
jgi:hypothetical protein